MARNELPVSGTKNSTGVGFPVFLQNVTSVSFKAQSMCPQHGENPSSKSPEGEPTFPGSASGKAKETLRMELGAVF